MKRIGILDDDVACCNFVCRTLLSVGYMCHAFTKSMDLIRHLQHESFDLLILDWSLPDMDGNEVLYWIRQRLPAQLPVIFMTARSGEDDIARMLNNGADDYAVKPVRAPVLLARVNALLRRVYTNGELSMPKAFGAYLFDHEHHCVMVNGQPVALTQKEFDLALLLFQHLNQPLSRGHILDVIWRSEGPPSRTMDTHISMLRTKLGLRSENGFRLVPIYGHGYRLEQVQA